MADGKYFSIYCKSSLFKLFFTYFGFTNLIISTSSLSTSTDLDNMTYFGGNTTLSPGSPSSRAKRFVYLTSERRLTLPPSTILVITPALNLPFVRGLPTGYKASMTVSLPFSIDFDDLGLTSEENPWGLWPSLGIFRKKRDAWSPLQGVNWAGGDREMMYQVVEDFLQNMGFDGKSCLLRAICEIQEEPLFSHGFFGEMLEVFLSPSRAPHCDSRLPDYVEAEEQGTKHMGCVKYYKNCAYSLFTNPASQKWSQAKQHEETYHSTNAEEEERKNEIKDFQKKKKLGSSRQKEPSLTKKTVASRSKLKNLNSVLEEMDIM